MLNKFIRRDAHFNELLKGSSIAFILKLFGMLISFVLMYYITNNYGASQYGTLTLVITILSMFMLLIGFGTNTALVRLVADLRISSNIGYVNDIFWKSIFITMPIAMISYFLLTSNVELLSNVFFHDAINNNKIRMGALTLFPLLLIGLIAATLQGMKKILTYSFLNTIILQLSFLIVLMINKIFLESYYNLISLYVTSIYSSFFVALIFYFIYFKPYRIIKSEYTIKQIISTSFPMLIASSFGMLMNWTDVLMLGYFQDESSVGIYNVSNRVATVVSIILVSINTIAAPKFVEFYTKNDFAGLEKIVQQTTKLIFFTTLPIIVILILAGIPILNLFGNEFTVGYSVLLMLIFGQLVNSVSGSVGYIMQMTDNQKIFQNVVMLSAILNIVLNSILIPRYGINGAAFASMTSMVFWNITLVILIKRKLGFLTIYIPFRRSFK